MSKKATRASTLATSPMTERTKKVKAKVATPAPVATPNARMFDEWKRGAPLHQLVKDFGPMSRSRARAILTSEAGGKAAFQSLRQEGAGGRATPRDANGVRVKRTARTANDATTPKMDDSNVPMILSCRTEDGWTQRFRGSSSTELVFTSPEGISYVRAADTQAADLIHIGVPEGLPPVRLRIFTQTTERRRAAAPEVIAAQTQKREQRKVKREKRRTRLEKRAAKTGR